MKLDRFFAALVVLALPLVSCSDRSAGAVGEAQPELDRLSTAVEQRFAADAAAAKLAIERIVESLDLGTLNKSDASAVADHMYNELIRTPGLAGMRFADHLGNFLRVWREGDRSISTRTIMRGAYGSPTARLVRRWPGAGVDSLRENRIIDTDTHDPRGTDWYEAGIAAVEPVWLPATAIDDAAGRVVAMPFQRDGALGGALAAEVDVAPFAGFVSELRPPAGWRVYLLASTGSPLAVGGAGTVDDRLLVALAATPEMVAVHGGVASSQGLVKAGGEQAAFALRRVAVATDRHWVVAVLAPVGGSEAR